MPRLPLALRYAMPPRPAPLRPVVLATLALAACASSGVVPAPMTTPRTLATGITTERAPAPGRSAIGSALSVADSRWIDSTVAALSLRDRVAQLVTVWVLGDYVNRDDSSFVQVRRWIGDEHVGGVIMSLGSPLEVAAKVNAMQRLALATP
ncbi:MAG: hypothetical protein M3154_04275, partial [Candidatus Eremiobacteraeota bacterium]|nr:hypothetical protein [Candidatus Eremiobacteraeota bacterium]